MELESLHIQHESGVEMIIAIDSTLRGPALGGCRWKPYPDSDAARCDAADLALAMTRKAAMAGLRLGGGKAVVIGDPRERSREQLLAFGSFVESLGGRYITAADMGTGEEEMAVIAERTAHVSGLPGRLGGAGSPGPFTALGVHRAIEVALAYIGRSLEGAHVAVQGVGSVGLSLAEQLIDSGASLTVCDPNAKHLERLPEEVRRVTPEEILEVQCDVFAPCGPPRVIDASVVERLRCSVVCGAANNPLSDSQVASALARRGVLYVPDFVANAGGLIHLAVALERGTAEDSVKRIAVIPQNVTRILEYAEREGCSPAKAAEALASAAAALDDAQNLG